MPVVPPPNCSVGVQVLSTYVASAVPLLRVIDVTDGVAENAGTAPVTPVNTCPVVPAVNPPTTLAAVDTNN